MITNKSFARIALTIIQIIIKQLCLCSTDNLKSLGLVFYGYKCPTGKLKTKLINKTIICP